MRFRVLWDHLEDCPYLPERMARMPLRAPLEPVTPEAFDQFLEQGDRRSGRMLYRTQCPSCTACHPLRVPIAGFVPSKSQRRVLRRNADVKLEVHPPSASPRKLELYNRHKLERGLSRSGEPLGANGYRAWLVESCVRTMEVHYLVEGRLIAVSILDFGRTSVSSVYHYFDPDEEKRSIGVYSVLRELELCKKNGYVWYYLGFHVQGCSHLEYKAQYVPHQKKIDGVWVDVGGG